MSTLKVLTLEPDEGETLRVLIADDHVPQHELVGLIVRDGTVTMLTWPDGERAQTATLRLRGGWYCSVCGGLFPENEHPDNGCEVSAKYGQLVFTDGEDLHPCCCATNPGECPVHEPIRRM